MPMTRRQWQKYGVAAIVMRLGFGHAPLRASPAGNAPEPSEQTWLTLKNDIFGNSELNHGVGVLSLDTPTRAEDAACGRDPEIAPDAVSAWMRSSTEYWLTGFFCHLAQIALKTPADYRYLLPLVNRGRPFWCRKF
jgi:hypothetical protein